MELAIPITFKDILKIVPNDELGRTWPAKMTIMMRMTSKSIREAVDEGRLPVAVSLNWQIYINNITEINCIFQLLNITSLKLNYFYDEDNSDEDEDEDDDNEDDDDEDDDNEDDDDEDDVNEDKNDNELLILSKMLSLNERIIKLDLRRSRLENNSIKFLKEAFQKLENLSDLDLDCNNFSFSLEFMELLIMLPKLVRLDLSSNPLFNEQNNENILSGQILHLEELTLRFCDIPRESYKIFKLIEICPKLVRLDLSNNGLYGGNSNEVVNEWIKKLPQVLSQCLNLAYLDLSYNNIDAEGAMHISTLLQNHNFVCLKLSHNIFKDEGVANIANALSYCPNLAYLDLSSNKIEDKGTSDIVDALLLCHNSTLTELDLSSNKIGNKGASCIARLLTQCSMTCLNLSCNQIKNGGAAKIENVLQQYHSLTSLYIYGNQIGSKELMRLEKIMSLKRILKK